MSFPFLFLIQDYLPRQIIKVSLEDIIIFFSYFFPHSHQIKKKKKKKERNPFSKAQYLYLHPRERQPMPPQQRVLHLFVLDLRSIGEE